MDESKNSVSRRTVVKGAAWSVPVIAMASTVPAVTASPGPPSCATVYFDDFRAGCYPPVSPSGYQNYEWFVRLINTSGQAATFTPTEVNLNGSGVYSFNAFTDDGSGAFVTPHPWFQAVTLQPGQSITFRAVAEFNAPAVREPVQFQITMHYTFFNASPILSCTTTVPLTFTPADSCPTTLP